MSRESPQLLPPRPDGGYDATGKSPEQIEHDIVETRAELGEILDAIERRLAPRHLVERGIDMMKDTMTGENGGLADTLRSYPVPLALIGVGVGWLLMSETTRARIGEYGGALKDRVADAAQSAGERAGEFVGEMRDKVAGGGAGAESGAAAAPSPTESASYAYARQKTGEAMHKASAAAGAAGHRLGATLERGQQAGRTAWQQARSYAHGAGGQLNRAGDRFGELMQEHPLALGALGLLAGAAIALLLPKSGIEERDAGDALRQRAADLGREAGERARHVAERTVDAMKDAAGELREASAAPPSPPAEGTGEAR
ncbi:MAG TPA: DUF3618 domain-containing protein [Stellaceae bacterium]|nr:DUF3618 domain-containing protein [Stellaceae bacterium]